MFHLHYEAVKHRAAQALYALGSTTAVSKNKNKTIRRRRREKKKREEEEEEEKKRDKEEKGFTAIFPSVLAMG